MIHILKLEKSLPISGTDWLSENAFTLAESKLQSFDDELKRIYNNVVHTLTLFSEGHFQGWYMLNFDQPILCHLLGLAQQP